MLEGIDISWVIAAGIGLFAIAGVIGFLMFHLQRQRARLAHAQAQIETLTTNLSALCAGSVGMNRRLNRLEQHHRALQQRQDQIEVQEPDDCSYGEAIQMVRQGATAPHLVEKLGIGDHEAELIVMLHGMKETG